MHLLGKALLVSMTTRRVAFSVAAWLVLAVAGFVPLLLSASRTILVAGHEARVSPISSSYAVVRTGPVLPDVRFPVDAPVGVEIWLGGTQAADTSELMQRYAVLASHPQGQVAEVRRALNAMAFSAALRAAGLAAIPVGMWWLIGARRRGELRSRAASVTGVAVTVGAFAVWAALWQPWSATHAPPKDNGWHPLADSVSVQLPASLAGVEVSGGVATDQYARLVDSAVSTYTDSEARYRKAAVAAADLALHRPEADETVAVLVTDRHDNIGMDEVARAIGDAGGATVVLNGGDDTSTGSTWEAFSLDSVTAAFDGYDLFGVAGNHDSGGFVTKTLASSGWTMLNGKPLSGPGGSVILGVDDPRSSGLGNWRKETARSFADVQQQLAETACAAPERINTMLVHDANLGRIALAKGCVDLVVGGHVHVQVGPNLVRGDNGQIGYTYTNGTTGGAAYAIALGRTRREATVTLITYRDGRPVGIQPVVMQTNGRFDVGDYVELVYDAAELPTHPDLTAKPDPTPQPPEATATPE